MMNYYTELAQKLLKHEVEFTDDDTLKEAANALLKLPYENETMLYIMHGNCVVCKNYVWYGYDEKSSNCKYHTKFLTLPKKELEDNWEFAVGNEFLENDLKTNF